jgi:crotonobetainyl-CoA:carnitine CoA-transferase CaiB-like acyl-CoA transferase
LRKPEARDLLLRLLSGAAIFVESFRPGTLEAMDLAPDRLLAANPKLVIVRVSGWGQDGPYRRRPGFGTLIEGLSGFASMNGFADREPVLPPMYLADTIAGLNGAAATLVALRAAERSGKGQVIDLPLLDPLFATLGPQAANYRLTGKVKARTGSRSTNSGPRNAYRCKDGKFVGLSASTQKMAERVLRSIGRPELIDDPRYRTNAERVKHAEELDAIIGAFVAERTQAENVAFFEQAEVTIGSDLRHCANPRGPARHRARAARRLPGRGHGRIPHASRGTAPAGHAGLDPHASAQAGGAQPGIAGRTGFELQRISREKDHSRMKADLPVWRSLLYVRSTSPSTWRRRTSAARTASSWISRTACPPPRRTGRASWCRRRPRACAAAALTWWCA